MRIRVKIDTLSQTEFYLIIPGVILENNRIATNQEISPGN
jgi:hypothetical protein